MSDRPMNVRKITSAELKERTKLKRHKMPEQDPKVRARNFEEVNLGYTAETAIAEAKRCLLCPKYPCSGGCPVHVKIPEFVDHVARGDFAKALAVIKEDDALPEPPNELGETGQAVHHRHGDVQRDDVRREPLGFAQRFDAVRRRADDRQARVLFEEPGHGPSHQRRVVHDENSQRPAHELVPDESRAIAALPRESRSREGRTRPASTAFTASSWLPYLTNSFSSSKYSMPKA